MAWLPEVMELFCLGEEIQVGSLGGCCGRHGVTVTASGRVEEGANSPRDVLWLLADLNSSK